MNNCLIKKKIKQLIHTSYKFWQFQKKLKNSQRNITRKK